MASPLCPMKYFRELTDRRNFIIESEEAVVIKAYLPKALYHFLVVTKHELGHLTELTEEHLPLLDHLMDLANQVIERHPHIESRHFYVGFKITPFWNRLNLHVISDDFFSTSITRPQHWNSFNTELFLPFQVAYTTLSLQGAIEPFSEEKCKKLQTQLPLKCNQCDFSTSLLFDLKTHLFKHWWKHAWKHNQRKTVESMWKSFNEPKLKKKSEPIDLVAVKPSSTDEAPISSKTREQDPAEQLVLIDLNELIDELMNLPSSCNPFHNIPPRRKKKFQNRMSGAGFKNRGNMRPHAPQVHWNGPRYAPQQLQPDFRQPASSGGRGVQFVRPRNAFRPPPSYTNRNRSFQQGLFPTPNASIHVAPGAMTARPSPRNQQDWLETSASGNGNSKAVLPRKYSQHNRQSISDNFKQSENRIVPKH